MKRSSDNGQNCRVKPFSVHAISEKEANCNHFRLVNKTFLISRPKKCKLGSEMIGTEGIYRHENESIDI